MRCYCRAVVYIRAAVLVGIGSVWCAFGWESLYTYIYVRAIYFKIYISKAWCVLCWYIWVCGVDHGNIYVYMARRGIEMIVRGLYLMFVLCIYARSVGIFSMSLHWL